MSNEDPREAALDWTRRALLEELREAGQVRNRAENLVAIAIESRIPIEDLIMWIHEQAPGKQWSGAEFRRFAELYNEMKAHAEASQ